MKKSAEKVLISVIGASLTTLSAPFSAYASAASESPQDDQLSVSLRIEGIESCIFNDTLSVSADGGKISLADFILLADEKNDSFIVSGIDSGYITAVNDDTEKSFGGWDGWLYTVNGIEPTVGINDLMLADGDSVILFYSDKYGVGMQFPRFSLDSGYCTFESVDTVYDDNWNPTDVVNPVADMTVMWDGVKYTTDENGRIPLPVSAMTKGVHECSYEKYAESGLPLVLRSEPGFTVSIDFMLGDTNLDNAVDASDASVILREYALSATGVENSVSPLQLAISDTNGDNAVDSLDASNVLAYYSYAATGAFTGSFEDFMADKN